MIVVREPHFARVWEHLSGEMRRAPVVSTERWQGRDVSGDPSARTHELRNVEIEVPLSGIEDLDAWRRDIRPNLPWADDHFQERVGGDPLNPGKEWENWPWAKSADSFREKHGIFNHTYAERLWPKWPRMSPGGSFSRRDGLRGCPDDCYPVHATDGIGWSYGDLGDLVDLLAQEPYTRQAYIPLFFPEDTGRGDGGRKPCTLGYHFMVRDDRISVWYPLRSCDLVRHFRDDCYLAVRLLLWVLDQCRETSPHEVWKTVVPGTYSMHCTSLHVFANDMIQIRRGSIDG